MNQQIPYDLSIIIITWNSERFVSDCLTSVFDGIAHRNCELIFVENGSTDGTRTLLAPFIDQPNVCYLPQEKNLGVARARNIGFKHATGRYIWLLDIDTVINGEAVEAMVRFLDTHDECGICGCKLFNGEGEVQESCRKIPSFRYKMLNALQALIGHTPILKKLGTLVTKLNESQYYHHEMAGETPFEVEYLIGACQMIRRDVIEKIGLLDEKIFYGPEDADFCLRTREAGWKIYYLPAVQFCHYYQKITNKRLFSPMSWVHTKALFYFFLKHKRF